MDADTLRLVLILAGALALVGLYLWERRRRSPGDDEAPAGDESDGEKGEPRIGPWDGPNGTGKGGDGSSPEDDDRDDDILFRPVGAGPDTQRAREPVPEPPGPWILQLHVVARRGRFDGAAIVHQAGLCSLEPGEMDIFHRYAGVEPARETLFSMANMVEPGTFPFGAMADFVSPGLTLFAQVEGFQEDQDRVEAMLATAHALADGLGGEIRDETRTALTPAGEQRLRGRVMALVTRRRFMPERK